MKKAEQERWNSETLLTLAKFSIDKATVPIFWIKNNGQFLYVNDAVCKSLDYSREELLSMTVHDIDPNFPPKIWRRHWAEIKQKRKLTFESLHKKKNGIVFPVQISINLLKFKDEEYNFALALDISERRKIEQSIQESEKKLNSIIRTIPDIIYRLDIDGNITFISDAVKLYGYSPEELIGVNVLELVHPEDRAKALYRINERRSGDRSTKSLELRLLRKDKVAVPFEEKSTGLDNEPVLLINAEGIYVSEKPESRSFIGTQGVARDITERKRTEEALILSEERFSKAFNANPTMMSINRFSDGRCIAVNDSLLHGTGFKREELIGRSASELNLWGDNEERAKIKQIILQEKKPVKNMEVRFRTKLGKMLVGLSSGELITIGGELCVLSSIIDITDRKRMEEEILKSQKLESLGILAGGIAHDFNNILMGIVGNISLAKMDVESNVEIFERLEEAENACMRAKDLTYQLLTFSKGGKPVLNVVSIGKLVEDSVNFALRGSNVRCEFTIPEDFSAVEIDEGQIGQVINNLVINAWQAMPEGGIINIRLENIAHGPENSIPLKYGKYVKLSIRDHGIGIPEEHLSKIFDPYFTTKQKGSGLGLASVYSIVRNHNGCITVDSKLGKGSTFSVYLPASDKKIKKEEKVLNALAVGGGKILIMDDEEMVRDTSGSMLLKVGYEVEFARDGKEAIDLYTRSLASGHPFDVVIMDLTIPAGMSGKTAIKKLLDIDRNVKAIVSSGYSTDPIMANYRKYGFSGVIVKPYKMADLIKTVQNVIAEKKV